MELLLLLSALICGLTDTVRTAVVRAPHAIEATRAADPAVAAGVVMRALVAARVPVTRPAVRLTLVRAMPRLTPVARIGMRVTPERRRE